MKNINKSEKLVEPIEEEKVVSVKRVLIAFVIFVVVCGFFIWCASQILDKFIYSQRSVLGQQSQAPANVRLPQKGDAHIVAQQALEFMSDFSVEKYIASDSAVGSAIRTLQQLQKSERGVEDYF